MILCEEPYLNEPAWANCSGSPQSRNCKLPSLSLVKAVRHSLYLVDSANVRRMVVSTAVSICVSCLFPFYSNPPYLQMLGNLKNPPEPFGDLIRTHFRLKARSILTQLDGWLAEDNGQPTVSDGAAMPLKDLNNNHTPVGSSANFQRDAEELKALLIRLQKGTD